MAPFREGHRKSVIGLHRDAEDLAGIGRDPGGDIDRNDLPTRSVHQGDRLRVVPLDRMGEPGAEEGVDDQIAFRQLLRQMVPAE
ncbi:MAG: hypothetical protein MPW14_20550 [Candidatus Manganitrophus sp.]|nr:MAG: hypothetical protein MPW17_09125 [Candidatus Manganitrophus sp.]WDT79500.1 MAG: hypothetical protein MPW14_20550 [Candidatus Manganitrophus sp.]